MMTKLRRRTNIEAGREKLDSIVLRSAVLIIASETSTTVFEVSIVMITRPFLES